MANKILKTLTLPNAQGEPVTYELHPEWDNIENKNYEYIVQASFVNGGNFTDKTDITLIDFNWESLIQAIQENKRVICRMIDEDSLVYTDFLFTEYDEEQNYVSFVCSSSSNIEDFSIYPNGGIDYRQRRIHPDTSLTFSQVPADAKAAGDALIQKLSVATTTGTGDAYTVTIPNAGPTTEGFTFIMIPHTDSTSDTINLSVNGVAAQLVKTDSRQSGVYNTAIYAGQAYMVTKRADPSFWAITNSSKVLAEDVVGCGLKNALGYSFDYIDTLKDTGWYWTFLRDASEGTTICGYSLQIGFPYMLHVENGNNKAVAKQTLTLPLYDGEVILTRSTDFDGVWHDWKEIVMTDKIPPNPNLLDNWYFADPINQRGQTRYTNGGFTIDRWQFSSSGATLTLEDGYISIAAGSSEKYFMQVVEGFDWTKTYTISVMLGDGTVVKTTDSYGAGVHLPDGTYFYTTYSADTGLFKVNFKIYGGTTTSIKAVKLEYGAVSTLVNDAPPKKSEQLLECQRYYIRFASDGGQWLMGASNGATLYAPLHLPVPMRVSPTFGYSNVNIYPYVSSGKVEITNLELRGASGTQDFMLYAHHASNALEAKQPGCIRFTSGGYIELSAEIAP